jgi:hypothetical protein
VIGIWHGYRGRGGQSSFLGPASDLNSLNPAAVCYTKWFRILSYWLALPIPDPEWKRKSKLVKLITKQYPNRRFGNTVSLLGSELRNRAECGFTIWDALSLLSEYLKIDIIVLIQVRSKASVNLGKSNCH